MPKKGASPPPLLQAFENASAPVYLVDTERRIVFANEALSHWVDLPLTEIVGRQVEYHSHSSEPGAAGLMVGLCPSPTALAGERAHGSISFVARDGRLRHRSAEFIPLQAQVETDPNLLSHAVLVLGEARDLSPEQIAEQLKEGGQPNALHVALQEFRRIETRADPPSVLLGESTASGRLRRQLDAIGLSQANALLVGVPGCGLSELARYAFYRANPPGAHRLVVLDAAVLESEAVLARIESTAEAATTITLLLENLESLPIATQTLVAEQLESGPPRRLFATAHVIEDLTVPLLACVGTIVASVPALNDRKEDLPLLAQWCVEQCNAESGKQIGGVSPAALEQLTLYCWPGDIEQLQSVVREAHARCQTPLILPDDLPLEIKQAVVAAGLPPAGPGRIVLDAFLGRIERELVSRALEQSGGNKAETARLLGMTRPRLYRRLATLGMLEEQETDSQSSKPDDEPAEEDTP